MLCKSGKDYFQRPTYQVKAYMSLSTLFVLGLPPQQHGAFQRPLNPANLPHWTLKVAWSDLAWPRTGTRPVSHEEQTEKNTFKTQRFKGGLVVVPDARCERLHTFPLVGRFWVFGFWRWKFQVERKWFGLVKTRSSVYASVHTHILMYTHIHYICTATAMKPCKCLRYFSFAFHFPNVVTVVKVLSVVKPIYKFAFCAQQGQVVC